VSEVDLKPFAPFAELTDADRDVLLDLVERRELSAGEVVLSEGDEADGLVLVERGLLEVKSERAGELATLEAGHHLGGLSLGSMGRREVTVTASEPSSVLLLSREAFVRLVEDAPRAATRILEAVLHELSTTLRSGLDRFL
jgi:NTE family protein